MTGSTPKHPYFTMISQFLKAASKPCKERKKQGEDSNTRKINEWRKKKRTHFPFNFISSTLRGNNAWLECEFLNTFQIDPGIYKYLLKSGSLDNAIEEFPLAQPSWYMSHYTMLCKYAKQTRDFGRVFIFSFV